MTARDKISLSRPLQYAHSIRRSQQKREPQVGERRVDASRLEIVGVVLGEGLCGAPRKARVRSQCEHLLVIASGNFLRKVMTHAGKEGFFDELKRPY